MKKLLLLFTFLVFAQYLIGQTINIPDEKLKQVLLGAQCADLDGDGSYDGPVDTNEDNEISQAEAEAVLGLRITSFDIVNPEGLQFFTNLEYLRLGNNDIEAFDLSPYLVLETFDCSSNEISELDFSNNASLIDLDCSGNNFQIIDVSALIDLRVLDLGGNMISSINLDSNRKLEKIVLGANDFNDLIINDFPNLTELSVLPNTLEKLEISNNASLQELKFRGRFGANNKLLDVEITDNKNLQSVIIELLELKKLDLSNNNITILEHGYVSTLEYFDISDNPNFSKPFSYRPILDYIDIENTAISSIQISGNVDFFNFNTNVPIAVSLIDLENDSFRIKDQTSINKLKVRFENQDEIHDVKIENLPLLEELNIRGKVNSLNLVDFPKLHQIEVNALSVSLNKVGLRNLGFSNFIRDEFLVSKELTIENCDSLTSIYYRGTTDDVAFRGLPNLSILSLDDTEIDNLIIENITTPELWIKRSDITNVEIKTNELGLMRVHSNNINDLVITNNLGLNKLDTRSGNLVNIDLRNNPDLVHYELNKHTTTQLNLEGLDKLKTLIVDNVNLQTIDIRNLPSLEVIEDKSSRNTQDMFLDNLPRLKSITAFSRNINPDETYGLQLEGFPSLDSIYAIARAEIRLCNLNRLRFLRLTPYDEANIDLSTCPALTDVTIGYIQTKKNLNLANGTNLINNLQIGNNIDTICVDNVEEQNLLAKFVEHEVIYNLSCARDESECEQLGNSNFTISGNILLDTELDCAIISDGFNYNLPIGIESGIFKGNIYSDQNNSYIFSGDSSDQMVTLRPKLDARYYSVEPNQVVINADELLGDIEQDFCISPIGEFSDIAVQLIPQNQIRPGRVAKYLLRVRNIGSKVFTGPASLDFDGSVISYSIASIEPSEINENNILWNLGVLYPLSQIEIEIEFELNKPSDTPPLVGDEILNFVANAPLDSDEDSSNNSFEINQTVVNSLDPNDKICLIGEELDFENKEDYLYYQIRFENIGTADAIDVEVVDEIDILAFDPSTFQPVDESHLAKISLVNNIVRYQFNDINLPSTEGANQGYVLFRIKAKAEKTFGDKLENNAQIFFDFNEAIKTNTYSTIILDVASNTIDDIAEQKLKVAPNPVLAGNDFRIEVQGNELHTFSIYSSTGELVKRLMTKSNIEVSTVDLTKGLYFLELKNQNKRFIEKLVVF